MNSIKMFFFKKNIFPVNTLLSISTAINQVQPNSFLLDHRSSRAFPVLFWQPPTSLPSACGSFQPALEASETPRCSEEKLDALCVRTTACVTQPSTLLTLLSCPFPLTHLPLFSSVPPAFSL